MESTENKSVSTSSVLIYYMFLSMLLIFNSKLYLFALFVIDQESPVCDQVNLCLYLSNEVGS